MNSAVILFSDNITGQWWRYNRNSQDFDELTIDENLRFTLKATIADKLESYEGQIHLIGSRYYYGQIDYNGTMKNCHISCGGDYTYMLFSLYEDETETIYDGWFDRRKILPSGKIFEEEKKEKKRLFSSQINFGTFGWSFNQSPDSQNEHLFSIEIYALRYTFLPLGLGLEIVPFKYTYSFLTETVMMSFLNTGLDWNILDFPLKIENTSYRHWFFGPTFSVNWLNLNDYKNLKVDNVIFDAGLKFSFSEHILRFISIEAGYRNNRGAHGFYFSLLTDNYIPVYFSPMIIQNTQ
jgi:hypothetical protein